MYNVKDFEGEVAKVNYEAMTAGDMVRQLLKEIAFYASGFGWSTDSNEAEEIQIMYPYSERSHGLTSTGYITNLKIMMCAEIKYQYKVAKTFKSISDFDWNIEKTNNEDFFMLILRKN